MATIEETAQAEKEYADVTARSGCVEFADKSLSVLERLIDIGSRLVSLGRTLFRVHRFMDETGWPPIVRHQHALVVTKWSQPRGRTGVRFETPVQHT